MSRNPIIPSKEKILEQEPEILPCRASASPLSPQPSAAGTPRLLGPSIKVWDPCNVLLLPPPPPLALLPRGVASVAVDRITEVILIAHGECAASLRPDLVGGRWADAAGLTSNGERQTRALSIFLKSHGVRFDEVYSSPLDRARATAALVCRVTSSFLNNLKSSAQIINLCSSTPSLIAKDAIFQLHSFFILILNQVQIFELLLFYCVYLFRNN